MTTVDSREKRTIVEKIGYGLGDTAANLLWRALMVVLPIFYTDVFILSALAVIAAIGVVRFYPIDASMLARIQRDRKSRSAEESP